MRRRLANLGVRMVLETAIAEWGAKGAGTLDLLTGEENRIAADSLVLATVNRVDNTLANTLARTGVAFTLIGDAAAPRQAAQAFHDGRKAALGI